jgi:lysine biosynthesis protein LysW
MEISLICKDCEEINNINLADYEIGDVIECEACGAEHELRSIEPLEYVLIEEEK